MQQISRSSLVKRRKMIEAEWNQLAAGCYDFSTDSVRGDIMGSWQRSLQAVAAQQGQAPVDDAYLTARLWKESLIRQAAEREQAQIIQLAREGELVAAIADASGRLLWTYASQHMQARAEAVNFTAGGRWDERSVGTNAVGLSLSLKSAVTVFSSEHYQSFVHDWVCYAAPIIHPQSGECVGILDLSTTWKRHTPLGQAAVTELARSIASCLPSHLPRAELEIYALGQPRVLFRGKPLALPQRYLEMLCLLLLNPQGLSLEAFHTALYSDAIASTATLKAEISHLRRALDGQIGSRPYRLLIPVWADFIQIWQALREQKTNEALALYRGSLMAQSDSPELNEWRHCIDVVMNQVLDACTEPNLLVDKICDNPAGSYWVRERLLELLAKPRLRW